MNWFINRPDVLDLVIDSKLLKKFSISNIDFNSWGKGDEEYCYFDGILIGSILGSANDSYVYYDALEIAYNDRIVINLTPMLNKSDSLIYSEYSVFAMALSSFLINQNGWDLICEADCEQNPVENEPTTEANIRNKLLELGDFCNAHTSFCPTFLIRSRA